jgi:hypothetical protein
VKRHGGETADATDQYGQDEDTSALVGGKTKKAAQQAVPQQTQSS